MNTNIEWLVLVTEKYEASKEFYRDTLGLPVVRDVPEEQFTQFQLGNVYLAIYGKRFVEKLLGKGRVGTPGSAIYSFAETDDIDRDYQQLKDIGVQFIKEPETQPWGQRTAYFTDPDGHVWEIQQWMGKEG